MSALAFDTRRNPMGARLQAIFSSDIRHWDVTDTRCVLLEAHESVEAGHLDEENFARFTFENAAARFTGTNSSFFEGTEVETAVKESRASNP